MRIVAGIAKGKLLKSPKGRKSRPTSSKVKSAFFNIIGDSIHNAGFLDLFSGTGNVGIEALSRGAERVVFVEKDSGSVQLLRQNIILTGMQEFATVLPYDVCRAMKTLGKKKSCLISFTSTRLTGTRIWKGCWIPWLNKPWWEREA